MEYMTMGFMRAPLEAEKCGEDSLDNCVATPGYGTDVCAKLKAIRDEEARKHGVDYKSAECLYMDICVGPCERCEREAELLYKLIYKKDE